MKRWWNEVVVCIQGQPLTRKEIFTQCTALTIAITIWGALLYMIQLKAGR